jgi:hypothetical protein
MSNLFDLDAAVVSTLLNDSTLRSLVPDGVYFGDAGVNASRFISVSRIDHIATYDFGVTAWDAVTYQVKAVILSTSGANLDAAAARIQALLHDAPLTATGYIVRLILLRQAIRYNETDPANPARHWWHGGGRYEIYAIPTN